MMYFPTRTSFLVALAVSMLMVPAEKLHAQGECQCAAPGGEDSRIANAIGGGLFAGLIAAVIPFHHAAGIASTPAAGAGAPSALTTMSDSTDIAPDGSARPRALASAVGDPPAEGAPIGAAAAPISRTSNGETSSPLPSMTPGEAADAGLIAPQTATLLPALGMIGVGALLLGIFFIRVRRPRLGSH